MKDILIILTAVLFAFGGVVVKKNSKNWNKLNDCYLYAYFLFLALNIVLFYVNPELVSVLAASVPTGFLIVGLFNISRIKETKRSSFLFFNVFIIGAALKTHAFLIDGNPARLNSMLFTMVAAFISWIIYHRELEKENLGSDIDIEE